MFCHKCGTSMADVATACPSCHAPTAVAQAGAAKAAAVADTMKAAWGSAFGAFQRFASDPVGRLPGTYEALGDANAKRVGLTYGVVSVILFLLGGYMLLPFKEGLFDFLGFSGVMKCLLFGVLPFGCTALGSTAVRKAFGGQGGLGGDLFIAGAALLPMSLAMPVNGFFKGSFSAMAVVSVFAATTGVLTLYSGYSRISKLSERATTLAIPIVVVLVFWLGKTIAPSVLQGSFGGGFDGGFGGGGPELQNWGF